MLHERAALVPRGVAGGRIVVASADGARLVDVDGKSYLDFAGGIACQNLGHRFAAVSDAIRDQLERFTHQCFMVATYEPYLEVCRQLAALSPCAGKSQKTVLFNSGAEAVENAVKIARVATGRSGVLVFGNSFHGRTLLTMTMTGKVKPYKLGGPLAGDVYRALAPYPYRGISTADALASVEALFTTTVDPAHVACFVLEPVQGEGGFLPMPVEFVAGLARICDEFGILFVDDEIQTGVGRTGRVWAIDHLGVAPDLLVSGKSLGGGLPLAAVTGRAEIMDVIPPGGLGGTFGGNPLSCVAAEVVLKTVSDPAFLARTEQIATALRTGLDQLAERYLEIGEVRGLGPMLALEMVADRESRQPSAPLAKEIVDAALERGLLILTAGAYGNVVRLLPPLTLADDEIDEGLRLLGDAIGAVCAQRSGAETRVH
jgi:4-aminobutyrate aminotransferase / (S)-3-amino-2-methylpropionate transaminase / 5-aminovalerate transaminase